ncbi:hypothetical protein ZOD2009_05322 [Haladaptatus paucihalophilus DX253]|uniref:Membrane-spanning protein n=1 Tax=Haladaptatus paucihalophilus DX253 TaxID=797209 RepID=E7QQJ4_HALPU|nr:MULTISPECIES: hypothetical protein [Haladaptatus]EFW93258.1 hypothetical protein ZOD2009_05322 [Haladaptatus paucihalophilus DX253]GKZ12653.1 hypothetical protein HAL_05340 [Haladaptatus sp. T7]SHK49494.1 hypothetical protein SAMN05444342_1447 [Haladaptatus paucihalophilus DX253]
MRIRERLGISEHSQRQLTRLMELSLIGIFFVGMDRGNLGIMINSALAFAITLVPAVLKRDYQIPMDAGLTLWITTAVFLHAVGTLGPYQNVWWWDHVTHMLSASLVAGVGYATVRALDAYNPDVYLPPRFMFVFILMFVVAFGVIWEVTEFAVSGLGSILGGRAVLTQYGLEDTMLDLLFDTAGGLITAVWGTAYLTDVTGALADRLDTRMQGSE